MTPGEAIIARLKASLQESGVETGPPEQSAEEVPAEGRAASLAQLKASFEADRDVVAADREWSGSGKELLSWHFRKTLGRYFNDPARIDPMVARMARAADTTFWSILGVTALLAFLSRRTNGFFHWLLLLVPATLPLLFVVEYASWLWWYGHNMSDMGAFTLKPFMPTVFGQGKVAQFTTSSYPHVGFWLMLAFTLLLLGAAFVRRRALQDGDTA